ncbi:hypothetical protein [Massilia sp. DD77]|uniref:hypothetical protein n=1 Tax=Massilia sp. DD77 TaxID=3109349 RepID=UPI002FFE0CDF
MSCEYCTDPDGAPCVPYYGVGPHRHAGDKIIGSTVLLPEAEWPTNYREDPDEPGCGVWWCGHCGEGKPDDMEAGASHKGGAEGKKEGD